jgi:hypothetical protein
MKKILLTIAAIALFAAPVSANVLSMYADADMLNMEVTTGAPYQPFNVYVFLEPGVDGAFAVEYMLAALPGHFSTTMDINPVVSGATIGVWFGSPGISAPFTTCQSELFWLVNLTMMSPDLVPGYYTFELNESSQFMGVATCEEPMRPMVDGTAYNMFGFNTLGVVGTEESSWGAIKSMMND